MTASGAASATEHDPVVAGAPVAVPSGGQAGSPVLTVAGLDGWIGDQQVLHGVSFEVPAAGVTALLGRNGVGKTSTLRAILGLIRRAGQISLAGQRIEAESTHRIVRRGVGYVPENREVFAGLSVAENLTLARRNPGSAGQDEREALVDRLFADLRERRGQAAGTLSGGQQQMLALARALLNDNLALLIDEPTKGLAPRVVDEVAAALEIAARQVPILLVEQDLSVVARLANRVVVMAEGRVAHTGDAQQFLDDPALVRQLLGVSR